MEKSTSQMIEEMRLFDLRLRSQLELAETWVPQINIVVENLRRLGLLQDMMVLGEVVHSNCYNPMYGPEDSGQLLQAAFGIGHGGLGAIVWDSDEYWKFFHTSQSASDKDELWFKFSPYVTCSDATRGLLLPQIRPLIRVIAKMAGV